jgi:hypothetical protein
MKTFLPKFHDRFSFKSIKIGSLYIKDSKPVIPKLDTCNLIYQFKCTCNKSYVGRTKRVIRIRGEEHRTFSRAKKTNYHMHRCPIYVKKLREYMKKFTFHRSLAKILKLKSVTNFLWTILKYCTKNIKTYKDLGAAESYFIRIHRPSLNDQKDHKSFALF